MPRAAPAASAFNAGELSPRMAGRVNTDAYAAGCHKLENFIPDIAGPAVKRGGTPFVAAQKDMTRRAWGVRFELTAAESYMLEFGHLYIRFFTNRAPLNVSGVVAYNGATAYVVGDLASSAGVNYYCILATTGNAPPNATYWYPLTGTVYEIPSPYTEADLVNADGAFAISYVQSGDIIYLAHRSHKPRKLSRYAATTWTLTDYEPAGGPFQDVNIAATTVYASASTGVVTLTASTSIFVAALVGTLFYLEQKTVSGVKQWEAAKAVVLNDTRRSDARNYKALNAATTGTVRLTHTEGSVYDGDTGVQWEFLDAGYGWARITAVAGLTATATVLSRIPNEAVGAGNVSTKWAYGAWSSSAGYPDSIAFYLDRLSFGRDGLLFLTVAGDYENMQARDAGRQLTHSAIVLPIPSRRGNRILWQETLETGLMVGTGADEWLVAPASRNEPLGPLNISANAVGAIGSRSLAALRIFESIIFTQRSGKRLRAVRYMQGDGATYADLNAYADHVSKGFISLAYVAEPYSLIFGADSSGAMSACTYYPEQNVLGWFRAVQTGIVECVLNIPAPDGKTDDLWLFVRRTINGATKRYIEYMTAPLADDGLQADAFYVDCGITYSGVSTTAIPGLAHLEGQTVNVLVDGATHPQRTVSAGAITLQRAGTKVHVGLPYTATLATMDIEAGSATGTAQAKMKRIYRMAVRLLRTLGGRAGTSATKLDTLQFRDATVLMGTAPPLFTGDKSFAGPGGSDRSARGWFVHEDPLPATVVAIFPQIQTEDA